MCSKLRPGIGTVAFVLSGFFYPSKPIRYRYPDRTNNHKLEGAVLVEEDEMFLRQITPSILVYISCNHDSPNQKFYAAKQYVHFIQEGI